MAPSAVSISCSPDGGHYDLCWSNARRVSRAARIDGLVAGAPTTARQQTGRRASHSARGPVLPSVRRRVQAAEPGVGAITNFSVLRHLPDPTLGEVLALPVGDVFARRYGEALPGRDVLIGDTPEPVLSAAWTLLGETLGALPWGGAQIVTVERMQPLAVSLPGAVLIDRALVEGEPGRAHALYLVHELVHQWFGGLLLIHGAPAVWESAVDALARWVLETCVTPRLAAVFDHLAARYARCGVPDLERRARLSLFFYERLRADGPGPWRDLADAARGHVAAQDRRAAPPPPYGTTIEEEA
jgi:hypothetical protein